LFQGHHQTAIGSSFVIVGAEGPETELSSSSSAAAITMDGRIAIVSSVGFTKIVTAIN
jgi:hypothetical protein